MIPLAATAGAILNRNTLARDYLGFVSSIVRESQFVKLETGNVRMHGMERTRRARGLSVKLGDVGDSSRGMDIGTGVRLGVGLMRVGDVDKTDNVNFRKLYV